MERAGLVASVILSLPVSELAVASIGDSVVGGTVGTVVGMVVGIVVGRVAPVVGGSSVGALLELRQPVRSTAVRTKTVIKMPYFIK